MNNYELNKKSVLLQGQKWFFSTDCFLNSNDSIKEIGHKFNKCEFKCDMRTLWEDHILWTRCFIISSAHDLGDIDFTLKRLLKNQEDLGKFIGKFYSDEVKLIITKLLTEHIVIAGTIIQAVKMKNENVKDFIDKWYENANDISNAFHELNPKFWDLDILKIAMKKHLDDTLSEASHRLNGEYEKDINDYNDIHHHILIMADLLSYGLIKQFHHRF